MKILLLEPFYAGSHAQFVRVLTSKIAADWTVLKLPGRHWKWRMRGSAVWFAQKHADELTHTWDLLFVSSYVPLAELVGLCPQLTSVPRVLYFHENQLTYPVREHHTTERDLHFGMTQLVSALAATRCAFNSQWNLESFIRDGRQLLKTMPDAVPPRWVDDIADKSLVLPVPLDLPAVNPHIFDDHGPRELGPIILWNHRWEHDKAPEVFFATLDQLVDAKVPFRLIVCGDRFASIPHVFEESRKRHGDRILHWGFESSKAAYHELLKQAHIVVSTTRQEFFGVSVLEAVHFGVRPLVPDRLSFPELLPARFRYRDDETLTAQLTALCRDWTKGEATLKKDRRYLTESFGMPALERYQQVFFECVNEHSAQFAD